MVFTVAALLIETSAVPDVFVSGLARIEDLGANWRFTYFTLQRPLHACSHEYEHVVVARIIMPKEAAAVGMLHAQATLGTEVFGEATH